ncbi:MAG: hypothetical protein PHU34_06590 [Candidatus Methanoperedens sp.]|nr:hypothetical protein [Candidatus Methanoperedens sp.]
MARNKPENIGNGILKMRDDLMKLVIEEEAAAKNARKARISALKARYAAISSENIVSELPHRWIFFNKLLQKNHSYRKSRAEKLETKCRESDDTLKRLTGSRRALTASLAQALGVEPPANVSEQDIEEYLTKEKLQLQTISKELEEAEAALKEAALEKEKKEQKPEKPQEPVAIKARTETADEERERQKKAEAALKEAALEREKKEQKPEKPQEPVAIKARTETADEERERQKKAEAALKEAALEKEKKEQKPEKPQEPARIKAAEITDEERERLKTAEAEYLKAVEKEKIILNAAQKKRELIGEQKKEKKALQTKSKKLEEAEAALKEAILNRGLLEQELQNLKKSIETSVKTELTDEEQVRLEKAKAEHHNAVEMEKSIESVVKKKKEHISGQPEKYKPLIQFMLKELEEAESALKEAALERERKENELNNLVENLVESIETRVKANISEEKLGRLKKTEVEYLNALEKEKSIESEFIKKKQLEEKNQEKDKTVFQSLLIELEEAESALKESALEREQKECEFQNLKKALDIKAKPESTEKEV